MRYRHGCGPRGHIEINLPDGLLAMRGGRGWGGHWGPFHFDIGDEGFSGGGRGRGRRARRMFEGGELRLVLLKLIADEPRHGYDLIRAIEELTGGEYAPSPGVVYPTLTLLQDMGLIEEAAGEGPRKPFQATGEGRAHLEERSGEVDALIERLSDLKPRHSDMAGPAIGRAVRNLMTALSHRVGRDGLDEELLHEIAAILDDAAQRIERVK
jgi:DNA-binding PadR family transcriptional regulator